MARSKNYGPEFQKTRRIAFERDGNACVKCAATESLEAHHITPRDKGGSDDVGNLITLCHACHKEWEWIVYRNIPFEEWLEIAPLAGILKTIMHKDLWRDDVSASTIRGLFSANPSDIMATLMQIHDPEYAGRFQRDLAEAVERLERAR